MKLSGWGRYPMVETEAYAPRDINALSQAMQKGGAIAHGMGRAYGDCALGDKQTLFTHQLNRMISFDETSGQLVAEAGVLLADIVSTFLPRGWFPLVTPGTKFVTLGGMIAADVHGKNHHKEGSMAACVEWLDLQLANGEIYRCSRDHDKALFEYTLGGMGLTGIIIRAAIRLRRVETGWIDQTLIPAANFREAMAVFDSAAETTYSVAWIDCLAKGQSLGRSLVMLGEHAPASSLESKERSDPYAMRLRKKKRIPFDLPGMALNRWTVGAFNALYYAMGQYQRGSSLVPWDTYFYPLDAILGWNRIYGRRGFVQYQSVLPLADAERGIETLLKTISAAGSASFLAVLKRMGEGRDQSISFPMSGYTLALDFPASTRNLELVRQLNQITVEHGGRLYLAKDSLANKSQLQAMEPRCHDFTQMRDERGLRHHIESYQSRRLDL